MARMKENETTVSSDVASSQDVPDGRDGLPPRERHVVLGIMMSGATASCISQSMMIAALPTIMHEFAVDAALGQLLTTAYIFTLGLFSAMTGYLMNRINSKTLFIAAMACFVVGCVATLVAPNYPLLLASRLLQAGGAGISLPLIQLVALSVYPKSQYGRAMGIVGLIIGFAPAIGPTVSGVMIDVWGWRSVFVMLGCVAAVVIALTALFLRDVVRRPKDAGRFDVLSSLLYAVGFVLVLVGATAVESTGEISLASVGLFVAGVAVLALFAVRQFRIPNPFLQLACFKDRTFTVSTLLVIVSHIAFMAPSIMVPLFVQDIQGRSATVSGLTLLPGAVLLGFLNPVTGRLLDKHGPRPLIIGGGVLIVAGTVAFTVIEPSAPEWLVTVLYGVRTIGIACLMMPMTAHACTTLPTEQLAQGTAIITSFRQILGALSSSILIGVMAITAYSESGVDIHGFDISFTAQAAVVAVGAVIGLVLMPRLGKGGSRR